MNTGRAGLIVRSWVRYYREAYLVVRALQNGVVARRDL